MKRYLALATVAFAVGIGLGGVSIAAPLATPPNDSCTDTERQKHRVAGPDGQMYLTYAGQRDDNRPDGSTPTHCYFGVEHGTYPRAVGIDPKYWPPYNYATAKGGVPVENEQGFKSAGFIYDGKRVLYTLHRESGTGLGHACVVFHEAHIVIVDDATGELLFRRSWLANFGPALYNRNETLPFRPSACPNQLEEVRAAYTDLVARRLEPVQDAPDGQALVVYNPWQFGPVHKTTGLDGFVSHNRQDASHVCRAAGPTDWCASAHPTGTKGIKARSIGWGVRAYANGAASGEFCTDAKGTAVQECGSSGSVKQYIKPGFDWDRRTSGVSCVEDRSEDGRTYHCGGAAGNTHQDFEDANGKLRADKN